MSARQALDAILRSSFPSFIQKVFTALNPGQNYSANWHIDAIAHQLDQIRSGDLFRLMITMPPRSLKSICASVALPAFLLGHDPTMRIICVSYTQELASKLSRDFRKIIEKDWYRRMFPGVRITKDTESLIETSEGGTRFATSIGGALTGFGGNLIIIDDPMNADDASSDLALKKAQEYYTSTLVTRLDNNATGAIILVMQRLHEDDLAGFLLRRQPNTWTELTLPAIAEADEIIATGAGTTHIRKVGELLDPARNTRQYLDDMRSIKGSAHFSAQYQQNPVPADGIVLKREWLKTWTTLPDRSEGKVTQSWDTAMKGHAGADYSVCTTWLQHEGRHYLLDVHRERLEFPDLVKRATGLFDDHRPHAVLIEDHGSGTSLIQHLRSTSGIPVIERKADKDKLVRFDRVLPMFEAGQVYFPENTVWLVPFLKELLGFPSTRNDDQVDSVSQYLGWAFERLGHVQFECDWLRDDDDQVPSPEEISRRIPPHGPDW